MFILRESHHARLSPALSISSSPIVTDAYREVYTCIVEQPCEIGRPVLQKNPPFFPGEALEPEWIKSLERRMDICRG